MLKTTMRCLASIPLIAAAACGSAKSGGTPARGTESKATVTFNTHGHAADDTAATTPPAVCANFTLQPLSLAPDGTSTLAGSPQNVAQSTSGAETSAILGCIDSTTTGNDWGYLVTATGFTDCAGNSIPGLSPSTVTEMVQFNCQAGIDVPVDIEINVAIATPNQGGYIDISAGVTATDVQIGCKQADFDGDTLHFGSSWEGDPGDTAPDGLWGVQTSADSTQQFTGQVNSSTLLDQYYTGQMTLGAPGFASIVQTFLPSGCDGTYVATQQPECLTTATVFPSKEGETPPPPSATTSALLADAFIADATDGWATASILADGTDVQIDSASTLSSIPAGATPATNNPAIDDVSNPEQTINDPSIAAFTGIWPAHDQYGFVFTFVDTSGDLEWGRLTFDATDGWTIAGEYPLSGASTAQQACVGLFSSGAGSCIVPAACPQGANGVIVPRNVHFALAVETKAQVKLSDFQGSMAGSLLLPDTNGVLQATPVKFATADLSTPGAIDCSAAVPGMTQGLLSLSVASFSPKAGGNPEAAKVALAGDLPSTIVPYDCANPSDAEVALPLVLVSKDMNNNQLAETSEPDRAVLDQTLSPTTCTTDMTDSSKIDSVSSSSLAWSNTAAFPSGQTCAFRFREYTDASGNALDPTTLNIADATSVDPTSKISTLTTLVQQQQQQAGLGYQLKTDSFPASNEQINGVAARYGAAYTSDVRDPTDSTCASAAPAAKVLTGALVSGIAPTGNAFAYRAEIASGVATLRIASNAVLDCGQSPSAPPINQVNTRVLLGGSRGEGMGASNVIDLCVDPDSPDTLYATTINSDREGNSSRSISRVTLDLTDASAPIIDSTSSDIFAKAQSCMANRQSGRAAESRVQAASSAVGSTAATALPGTAGGGTVVENVDGGCAVYLGNGVVAFGHMQGWLFFGYCKIDFIALIG